jgi:hypothetical protein
MPKNANVMVDKRAAFWKGAFPITPQMRLREAMEDLKKHDEFTNQVLIPKYGKIIPNAH